MFAAPPERDLDWSDQGVEGASRFLNRLWAVVCKNLDILCAEGDKGSKYPSQLSVSASRLMRKTHQTIKKVTGSIERDYHFNTAIAALMELMNETVSFNPLSYGDREVLRFGIRRMVLLISPFAPHIAEELWKEIGEAKSILNETWPVWDEDAAREEEIELVIQVNGKVRDKVMIPAGLDNEAIREKAFAGPRIQEHIKDKPLKKVIIVKSRLVNIVV